MVDPQAVVTITESLRLHRLHHHLPAASTSTAATSTATASTSTATASTATTTSASASTSADHGAWCRG